MPQYQEPLDFLHHILDFQATLADKIKSDLRIEPAVAREKWRAGQHLFAGEPLSIPPAMFLEALADLRALLPAGGVAQMTLDQLLASSFMAPSNVETLLGDLVTDRDACIQQLADAASATQEGILARREPGRAGDPDTLAFLLRTVLSPFFEKQAAPYREWVETAAWRRGTCPICGSEPRMARLAHDTGRRILICFLCRAEWAFDRLRCPFCEGDDQPFDELRTQPQLRYFTVDGDEVHRVDCCDRCRRYIKTIDERVSGRPAKLLVEDVITAHLDIVAREQGYQ